MQRAIDRRRLLGGAVAALAGTRLPASATAQEPQRGGAPRLALPGDPPNLDLHQTADTIVLLVAGHIYETLYTWDARYQPVPLLAAGHEVSDDGLLIRLH